MCNIHDSNVLSFEQLCVNVADANDNCPMFSTPTINTTVAESLQIGTLVDTITAVDNDIGINAQFNYHIVGGSGQGKICHKIIRTCVPKILLSKI